MQVDIAAQQCVEELVEAIHSLLADVAQAGSSCAAGPHFQPHAPLVSSESQAG